MKTHARRGEAGFSFVELLVTIIIAGIAFAAMVPLFVQAAQRGSADRAKTVAVNIAQDKLEKIRTLDYDEIRADAADPTSAPNLYNPGFAGGVFGPEVQTQVGSAFKTFTVEYSVTEVRPSGSTSNAVAYKEVVVTVSWAGKGAASSRRVALRTNIDRQDSGPQITNLAVTPLTSDVVHEGSYILTSALNTTPVTLTATIAPADRTRVGRVEFRVDGVSGAGTFAQTIGFDTSNAQHVNGEFTWVWSAPRNIADGSYTFSAIAYSGALLITPTPPPSPSPSMGIVSGQPGNVWQVMYPLDAGAPGAVAVSRVEGAGAVGLNWTAPADTDIQRFDIYRRETGSEWPADPLHSADPALRYYIDESVVNGTSYDYRVQAVDDFELHGPFSSEVSAQPHLPSAGDDTTAPTTPTALDVAAQGPDVRLLWTAASDPAGPSGDPISGIWAYRVYRDGAPVATVGAAQTSFIDYLGWSRSAVYNVVALDGALNGSAASGSVTGSTGAAQRYYLTVTVLNRTATVTVTYLDPEPDVGMGTKTVSANASQTWATDKDPMAYGSYRVTAVAMVGTLKVTKTQDIKLTMPTSTTFTF